MTKDEVVYVIKRYKHIAIAITNNLSQAVFYVGNRKNVIEITREIRTVIEIIDRIQNLQQDYTVKKLIHGIKTGKSDICLMQIHYSKNAFYAKKQTFIDMVFGCCIYEGLVSIEEILNKEIA